MIPRFVLKGSPGCGGGAFATAVEMVDAASTEDADAGGEGAEILGATELTLIEVADVGRSTVSELA